MLKFYLFWITLTLHSIGVIQCSNLCGNWTKYKDQKCFMVVEKIASFDMAMDECKHMDPGSTLITINDQEEQQFINDLVRKYSELSFYAWLGMKYTGDEYEWIDDTPTTFTNWSSSRDQVEECVQMSLAHDLLGQWTDMPCRTQALILCQKKQELTLNSLMSFVKKLSDVIEEKNVKIEALEERLEIVTSRFDELQDNFNTEHNVKIRAFETSLREMIKSHEELQDHLNAEQNLRFHTLELSFEKMTTSFTELQDNITSEQEAKIDGMQARLENMTLSLEELQANKFNESIIEVLKLNDQEQIMKLQSIEEKLGSIALENITKSIEDMNGVVEKNKNYLETELDKLIPIGFIYTQLPEQSSPHDLWADMDWAEVTQNYSGLFFRAEGEDSEPFGTIQHANQSTIAEFSIKCGSNRVSREYDYGIGTYKDGGYYNIEKQKFTGAGCSKNHHHLRGIMFYKTSGEVRPKNTAVKIWKRTG